MIILNRIKEIRKELKLTQRDLANKCDLSHSALSDIENGRSIPTQISIILISKALDKNACDIFIFDHAILNAYFGRNSDHLQ